MSFSVQRSLARYLVLSPYIQASSGVGGVPISWANLTQLQRFDVSGALEITPTRRSDIKYAGKGSPFATDSQTTRWATSFNIKGELDDFMAGFLFSHALGQDTVTGSGPYIHVFEYLMGFDSSAPMTTIFIEDTVDLVRRVPDMALVDLTITIPKGGSIMFEANFAGSGIVTPATDNAWDDGIDSELAIPFPSLPSPTYFLAEEAVTTFNSEENFARMESMTLKLQTGVMGFAAMGDGGYYPFMRSGIPKISWSATVAAADTDDVETLIKNDTAIYFAITLSPSDAVSLEITIPKMNMKATKMGTDNDMTIWNLEADESGIQPNYSDDDGANGPMIVSVTNAVPAYLVPQS